LRHQFQRFVADLVAVRIIDLFEAIDVYHQQRHGAIVRALAAS